jgi:acetyl esterase/lipase
MRWILLLVSALFLGLGLLTVFSSPDWLSWKLNVLVVQFGYLLAVVPLAIALGMFRPAGSAGSLSATVGVVAAAAFLLLVQPCFQAWRIARRLPAVLTRQLGAATIAGSPFTFRGLFSPWPAAAPRRTLAYAGPLLLDFYPAVGRPSAPCVIVIHGGGWDDGDRGQIASFNDGLARDGYAVADISYRLAPAAPWPAQRDDVAAAVAYVKGHAAALGVDPRRLVIFGRSAGGQIAEAAGYELHDPAIRGVIGLYAPSDMNFAWKWGRPDDALNSPQLMRDFLGGTPETRTAEYDSASALLQVNAGTPPTLLVHGSIDTLVWNRHSIRLAARLAEAGVPHYYLALPWATHALELNPRSPSGQLSDYAVRWFLAVVCR